MKKNYLLLFSIFTLNLFSQNLILDNSFGANGIFLMNENSKLWDVSKLIKNDDGSIILSTQRVNGANPVENVVVKLTPNGTVDNSFGLNGYQVLNVTIDNGLAAKKQNDGKLVFFGGQNNSKIIRLLPNGQFDSTFGTNGEVPLPSTDSDFNFNNNTLVFQNDKILIIKRKSGTSAKSIVRYNNDGTLDTTFGVNGVVENINSNNIFIDTSNNIVGVSGYSDKYRVEKFDENGQAISTFGNNGILQVNIPFVFNEIISAYMDNENRIIVSSDDVTTLDQISVFRINSDGTIDNSFSYGFSTVNHAIFPILQQNTGYYLAGAKLDSQYEPTNVFLARVAENGSIDTSFVQNGYYVESSANLKSAESIIYNSDGSIILSGEYNDGVSNKIFVAKYIVSTLATNEIKNNELQVQNPFKNELKIRSKEEIKSLELYDLQGKVILKSSGNILNTSYLNKGFFVLKTITISGKVFINKVIKN
jgi:uncharacterized delta-60 repeat protein